MAKNSPSLSVVAPAPVEVAAAPVVETPTAPVAPEAPASPAAETASLAGDVKALLEATTEPTPAQVEVARSRLTAVLAKSVAEDTAPAEPPINPNLYRLLSRVATPFETRTTSALEIPKSGCLVHVSTRGNGQQLAESLAFVPHVRYEAIAGGGGKLVTI